MGMLIEGRWSEEDRIHSAGAFVRPASVFDQEPRPEMIEGLGGEPGRYVLIASLSCPWSQRALILRQLKGLASTVPIHIAHGPRAEGYSANGGAPWIVPGSAVAILHLHQLYTLSHPAYSGRSTVPILWDSLDRRIVSNESAVIMRAFDAVQVDPLAPDLTFLPDRLRHEIEELNAQIHAGLNNGVYRAGFAETQAAYESAVQEVFATLDSLERRLSRQRYLLDTTITDADWRLFPTLVRFDAVYYLLHKCCRRRLVDYPALWAYARDLYAWRGVADTVDFQVMREASFANDTSSNANGIVAVAPDVDWHAPHGRQRLGPARAALRGGGSVEIEPATLTVKA